MTPIPAVYINVLIAGLMFWLCLPCHARSADRNKTQSKRAQNKEMKAAAPLTLQIDLGNEAGGYGYEPLEALSSAIDAHPGIRFIQINWVEIVGSLSTTMTTVYDRHHRTIKYYCYGGHNAAGDPSDRVYAHYLYTGAVETVIRQAAEYEKNRDQGTKSRYGRGPYPDAIKQAPAFRNAGTPGSYYDSLLLFGCHRIKLP
jgi:hypothetical protein